MDAALIQPIYKYYLVPVSWFGRNPNLVLVALSSGGDDDLVRRCVILFAQFFSINAHLRTVGCPQSGDGRVWSWQIGLLGG